MTVRYVIVVRRVVAFRKLMIDARRRQKAGSNLHPTNGQTIFHNKKKIRKK